MRKKHFIAALAVVTVGAFVSVLAQNSLRNLPGVGWIVNSALAAQSAPVSAPAAPIFHDPHHPTTGSFNSILKKAQLSQHQDGDMVIVMATGELEEHPHSGSASGGTNDLPGTLTLKLRRDAAGTTVIGGEWAFNVSYTKVVHIENPEPGGEDHAEFLVQRGTIKGDVVSGQVTLDAAGAVVAVNSVQLAINGGSLTFHNAHHGTGSGQMSNLQDADHSAGTLSLVIPVH